MSGRIQFALFLVVMMAFAGCDKAEKQINPDDYALVLVSQEYGEWDFIGRSNATGDLDLGMSELTRKGIEINIPDFSFTIIKELGAAVGITYLHETITLSTASKPVNRGETIEFYYRTMVSKFEVIENGKNKSVGDVISYSNPQYGYILYDKDMNVIEDSRVGFFRAEDETAEINEEEI